MLRFFLGMALGFSLAVPPGPMNALIAAESLRSPRHGTLVGAGAMTADAILMIISLLLYQLIKPFIDYIYLAGGAIMMYLAYGVVHSAPAQVSGKPSVSYVKGVMMGITNPFQVGWWVTAGLSFISVFGIESVAGLFTAIIIWITVFPVLVNLGKKYGGSTAFTIIKIISAAAIIGFGIYFLVIGMDSVIKQALWR
ncbi:lysine transporter LysE [Thermocladium modestius]|uniref:Lysine transporter LysE n=1 Tax=Thermocladium modestius TaxID=62609 RepID=A0A830GVT5_9CREN|nr:LysE family transporter [Thermocladium modestius]GGP21258.1 lysine transporter LysE [Thermocladium modestius]